MVKSEELAEGHETERSAGGQFRKTRLTSDRAREMQLAGARAKTARSDTRSQELASSLCARYGLTDRGEMIAIEELAAAAVAGSASQKVKSLEAIIQLLGIRAFKTTTPLAPDQSCPYCGRRKEEVFIKTDPNVWCASLQLIQSTKGRRFTNHQRQQACEAGMLAAKSWFEQQSPEG